MGLLDLSCTLHTRRPQLGIEQAALPKTHGRATDQQRLRHGCDDATRTTDGIARRLAAQARPAGGADRRRHSGPQLQRLEREPAASADRGGSAAGRGRRIGNDRDVPQGAAAVRAAGRIDRPVRRCVARTGLGRHFAGANGRHRGDRSRQRDHDGQGRHAAGDDAEGGRRGRLLLSARSRRARLLRDRRQSFHQRRRQSRHPLRHDARTGARPRSGAAGRHRRHQPQQAAEEQRRLRPEAPVHRLRRHARHHHRASYCGCFRSRARTMAALCAVADYPAVLALLDARARRARPAAVGVRSDVAGLLGGDHGARRRALAGRHRSWPLCAGGGAGHR